MPPRAVCRPPEAKWLLVFVVLSALSAGRVSGIQEENKQPEVPQPAEVTLLFNTRHSHCWKAAHSGLLTSSAVGVESKLYWELRG